MRQFITIWTVCLLISCSEKIKNKHIDSNINESKSMITNKVIMDSINSSFPVIISNGTGTVKIFGKRTFINNKLYNSEFMISLKDTAGTVLSKRIDNNTIHNLFLNDTLHDQFKKTAIIKSIEFNFIRSNTLYFKTELEDPMESAKIKGRFNLYYRTQKKGQVYGWITDSIKKL